MNIEEKMHVRTHYGDLGIIVETTPQIKWIKQGNKAKSLLDYSSIKNASHNIIELLEEGDYIGDGDVLVKVTCLNGTLVGTDNDYWIGNDIKAVLTKELYNSNKYVLQKN